MLFKDYGEIDFLKKISLYSQVEKIGNDAVDISISEGKIPLVTSDMLIEGTHFDVHKNSYFEVGFKAIAVNVSDIDAQGGISREALVSFGIHPEMKMDDVDQFYTGLNEAARYFNIKIIGGDIVKTGGGFVISISLFGEVEKELWLKRSGAKEDEKIYVTGCLGKSASKDYKISVDDLKNIGKKGRKIAQDKIASSMTDISDGLSRSLYDLSVQSSVGFKIFEDKIPLAHDASLDNALNGGEDFELMFTSKKETNKNYICIGEVTKKKDIILVSSRGKEEKIKIFGYNQFK